ncbi:MAG TPA: Sec-independent protein translocase protein TatB [Gammaproteobacteria bacterium]|nr:Sec-independent protein translocase protein TatB [Gammaproteobacteria bacterium]
MFDVGFTELVMIGLVALLVVGPERLPELVRTAGRWIGRAQRLARELRTELERDVGTQELKQIQRDIAQDPLNRTLDQTITANDTPRPPQGSGQA